MDFELQWLLIGLPVAFALGWMASRFDLRQHWHRKFHNDPANRWLSHQTPRRLEFEALRDSLLRVAGRLDTRLGGRSAPLTDDNVRRAVYGYTDRFRIPSLLRNFDVANPDQSIARRGETTHPLQALFFLNSPFVRAQAEGVNRQPEIAEQLGISEATSKSQLSRARQWMQRRLANFDLQ